MRSFAIEGSNPPIPALCATLTEGNLPFATHPLLPSFQNVHRNHSPRTRFPDSPGSQQVSRATWTAPHPQWLSSKILRSARQPVKLANWRSWLAVIYTRNKISPPLFTVLKVQNLQIPYDTAEVQQSFWNLPWGNFARSRILSLLFSSGISATELLVASGKRWTEPVVFYSLIIQFTKYEWFVK